MKLRPCPFCGSKADAENYPHSPVFYVSCSNLDCFARVHSNESLADAINKWNKRHNEVTPVDEVPNLDSQKREVLP